MARARHSSWRWPCDRFRPPSETGEARSAKGLVFLGLVEPAGVAVPEPEAVAAVEEEGRSLVTRWTRSRQSRSSASVWWSKGSRLERIVPEKRTGSYGKINKTFTR